MYLLDGSGKLCGDRSACHSMSIPATTNFRLIIGGGLPVQARGDFCMLFIAFGSIYTTHIFFATIGTFAFGYPMPSQPGWLHRPAV